MGFPYRPPPMTIRHFRDLLVWQKAMSLATQVYGVTRLLPAGERFGLVVQMQRAAVSVPANLAEGHERHSRGDFRRFVSIALGSLAELDTLLELAERLCYVNEAQLKGPRTLADEVGRMLSALLHRLMS